MIAEPKPREIPAGKVLLHEGYVTDETRAQVSVLEEREAKGKRYRLIRSSPGFEPAGSVARWTNGYYAVRFELGGALHGRSYRTLAEALETFERWTTEEEG